MKKSLLSVAGIISAAVLLASSAFAAAAGQIEGGDIYRVKNVSTNSAFVDPATGTCGNTFQFKVRIHNPGPDALNNVKVVATLPTTSATSHSSKVTVSASNANPSATTDTAGITLAKASKLAYVSGSTELLDANGSKLQTLGNTITTTGVNIGTVGVSTQQKRFVQFSVKTECSTPAPQPKMIEVCDLASKKVIKIDEKNFDSKKHSKNLNDCLVVTIPENIEVCDLESKEVITIDMNDFDSSKHSKDLASCEAAPVKPEEPKKPQPEAPAEKPAEVPAELPKTGGLDSLVAIVASALAAGSVYAVRGRNLLG